MTRFELQQGFFSERSRQGPLADHALKVGHVGFRLIAVDMACQSPPGLALVFLLPPPDHRRVHVVLARHLRPRLAGLDLADDLKLELMGELTTSFTPHDIPTPWQVLPSKRS
jgi:hypothetical protein